MKFLFSDKIFLKYSIQRHGILWALSIFDAKGLSPKTGRGLTCGPLAFSIFSRTLIISQLYSTAAKNEVNVPENFESIAQHNKQLDIVYNDLL